MSKGTHSEPSPQALSRYVEFAKTLLQLHIEVPDEFEEIDPRPLQQLILQKAGELEELMILYYEQFDGHFGEEVASWRPIIARFTYLLDSLA